MLSLRRDPEEEVQLQKERDAAEARGYPAWAADWGRAYRAKQEAIWGPPLMPADRMARFYDFLECRARTWDYGPVYLDATNMRVGAAEPPSYTGTQQRRDEAAERVEYGRRQRIE